MEKMTNSINWVEIPVLNFERAKRFYSQIYDFEMYEEKMGAKQMGFLPMNQDSSGVGGAIVEGADYIPTHHGPLVYLNGGDDLQEVLNRVPAANGKIVVSKTKISDKIGYFAIFEDTEGNRIALHSQN